LSAESIVYLALGAAAGGFINGLAGTGTALFALGFYLLVLPPVTAVAIVALMAVLAGLQGLWVVRAAVKARPMRVLRYIVPGLVGVPLGVLLLQAIDAATLRVGIALLLIVYGGYFSFRAVLPAFSRHTPWLDGSIGFIGGVLGGAASVSGAIPAMWLSLRPWPKAESRAVLQPYNMAVLTTTVVLLYLRGAYDTTALRALIIILPVGLIGSQIGLYVFKSVSDNTFRRLLIGLTLMMGLGILVQALL
jgi:uncharacterized membrane protein YfcA